MGMNNQEAFNKICDHLMTQLARSEDDSSCCYRGPGGVKCAVGCLLPDKVGGPETNCLPVATLLERFPEYAKLLEGINLDILGGAQRVHDHMDVKYWGAGLREVAKRYKLDPPPSIAPRASL